MKMLSALLFPLLLACLAPQAAQASSPPNTTPVASALAWLSLIDDGNYGESWRTASGFFRAAVSETNWTASLQAVRTPLGAPAQRKHTGSQQATSLPGAPDGEYRIMVFTTNFVHKKSATETVTFMLDQDGQWRAAGYFIK